VYGSAMIRDDDLHVRPGRVRDRGGAARVAPSRSLRGRSRKPRRPAGFGVDQGIAAAALLSGAAGREYRSRAVDDGPDAQRRRQSARRTAPGQGAPLGTHVAYLRREGVTKDGAPGRMFDAEHDDADHRAFAERCEGDRHHFRFIVSPQDAEQLSDLRAFTRDLMAQAERDLGTGLDWVAIDHWNTDNPHIHVIVRGRSTMVETW